MTESRADAESPDLRKPLNMIPELPEESHSASKTGRKPPLSWVMDMRRKQAK